MEKIKGGYYIKARCIQESDISVAAPYVREIWDWILKEANHKDTKICKRGQTVRSFEDIQNGLKWYAGWRKYTYSKDQCEKAMKWLRKATMIATRKTTRGLVITVLNYDKYQTPENYESNNESLTKATVQQQCADTINKNDKNDKNDKNILSAKADEKYDNKIYLNKLLTNKKKHIRIIGLYAQAKNIIWENIEQARSFVKRNLKPAQLLIGYSDDKIKQVCSHLEDNAEYKWTIETITKFIDEDLSKFDNQPLEEKIKQLNL